MAGELLTLGMFGSLVVLLLLGVPIAFVGGGVAAIFAFILWGSGGLFMLTVHVWGTMGEYALAAIPLFIFMAIILERAGIGERLFNAIHLWMGPVRGGLAVSVIIACTVIAAMVGTVGAGIVIMGLVALPTMLNRGYNKSLALGSILAGGGLGQLIPPSIMLIVYALVAGVSIGKLFLGGLSAGLLLSGLFLAYILVRCLLQPRLAPTATKEERSVPLRQKLASLKGLIIPVLLVIVVLGSVFFGVATPTESAGVGALGAMLSAVVHRQLTWQRLKEALFRTVRISCMLVWIMFGVSAFAGVFTLAGGADFVRETIVGLGLGPWGIMIAIQVFFLIMGVPMDWLGILMVTGPIFVPLIRELGFDPIWFGVLFAVNMQIAFLSPPVGSSMFYLKGVAPPDVTMGDIFRATLPFLGLQVIGMVLIMIFPQIVLWLPNRLLG